MLPLLTGYFAWKRRLEHQHAPLAGSRVCRGGCLRKRLSRSDLGATRRCCQRSIFRSPSGSRWESAYAAARWREVAGRMDFIRFSGELFIYYVLIALGGGVLTGFLMMMFETIGIDAKWFIQSWLLPCGAAGAVLVASWLVEAKQSVIENMAPVLTRLFTPFFAALLLTFLATLLLTGRGVDIEREVLIAFDLLLMVVLGLLLYSVSARDPGQPPGAFDVMQVVLVVSALLADAVALWAISARITEFGFTPNRVAGLGVNIILLVNLAWSAVLYLRFLQGTRELHGPRTMADGLPAGLCCVGGDRRDRFSAAVRIHLSARR